MTIWDQAHIEQLILQGVEENLTLDYKAAGALSKNDSKKSEITKDVSAMANSTGGIIIYGIAEDKTNRHLPGAIDPVDRNQFPKEWLEQIIGNIRPKIDGLVIHPISINNNPNDVVYVVEIPQSYTAHQAHDKRYYKRYNFESVAMEDYEIRDIMGRRQHPLIDLKFNILITVEYSESGHLPTKKFDMLTLNVVMINTGIVYAQYVQANIKIPCEIEHKAFMKQYRANAYGLPVPDANFDQYCTYYRDNTERDFIRSENRYIPEYGPSRYVPILPKTEKQIEGFRLRDNFEAMDWSKHNIKWTIYADNAPPYSSEIAINDIQILDKRKV